MTPYQTIIADPPWKFGDNLPGRSRGAAKNYTVLSCDELADLALPPIADDARLFLWRVASMQEEALRVVQAWGFTLKAEIVWVKKTKHGKRWFGMGRQVRMEHEVCLIATRGRPERLRANLRSVFEAKAGRHSEKPAEFLEIVESFSPGPYVELFARHPRPNWDSYGDELGTPLDFQDPA